MTPTIYKSSKYGIANDRACELARKAKAECERAARAGEPMPEPPSEDVREFYVRWYEGRPYPLEEMVADQIAAEREKG